MLWIVFLHVGFYLFYTVLKLLYSKASPMVAMMMRRAENEAKEGKI